MELDLEYVPTFLLKDTRNLEAKYEILIQQWDLKRMENLEGKTIFIKSVGYSQCSRNFMLQDKIILMHLKI